MATGIPACFIIGHGNSADLPVVFPGAHTNKFKRKRDQDGYHLYKRK